LDHYDVIQDGYEGGSSKKQEEERKREREFVFFWRE
jgi:hypothetical protein